MPIATEVYDSIPPEGISLIRLIATFKSRVDENNIHKFIKIAEAVSIDDKECVWIKRLPEMPSVSV